METVNVSSAGQSRQVLIGAPNEFLKHNPTELTGTYVPGDSLTVKNGKLFVNTDNVLNPYSKGKIEIIAWQEPFIFVAINKNSWFTFRTRQTDEGNTVFDSGRTHYTGINDNEQAAYQVFERLVADDRSAQEAKRTKLELLKNHADTAQAKAGRIIETKALRNAALIALKETVKGKPIADLLKDAEAQELVNEFLFYETILKSI